MIVLMWVAYDFFLLPLNEGSVCSRDSIYKKIERANFSSSFWLLFASLCLPVSLISQYEFAKLCSNNIHQRG